MTSSYGPWAIAVAVAVAAVFALVSTPQTPGPLGRGSAAPHFALPQLGSAEWVELSALRGRVVLVNFWATWCKPCEEEMPAMERLYQELQDEGFELLAVSVDETREPVQEFQRRMGLSFPLLLDSDKRVATLYQTFRFPETLLIGADGTVIERYVGPKEWDSEAYVERIRRLLAGV